MKLRDVMTRHVEVVRPDSTMKEAAEKMKTFDIGSIPVCDGDQMMGIITDRDIAVRAVAEGRDASTRVSEVMTKEVVYCLQDQDVRDAAKLMEERQIRRMAILDNEKRLVGIISLGDLAVDGEDKRLAGQVLQEVSEPATPKRNRVA